MYKFPESRYAWCAHLVCVALFSFLTGTAHAQKFAGVGRAATASEIAAWDIDVRADFQGLPRGSGSVAQGEKIWVARCASCHGEFAESPIVFPPLVEIGRAHV